MPAVCCGRVRSNLWTQQFVPASLGAGCAVLPFLWCGATDRGIVPLGLLSLHSRQPLMVDLAPLASLRCGAFSMIKETNGAVERLGGGLAGSTTAPVLSDPEQGGCQAGKPGYGPPT